VNVQEISERLRRLREDMEREAEAPVHEIDVPVAYVLVDVARALGLNEEALARILGPRAVECLQVEGILLQNAPGS